MEQAIGYEFERQSKILQSGGRVAQDTLLWDPDAGKASVMRSKEEAHDYRYFPEPDLRVLQVTEETIDRAREALPELPDARRTRFVADYKLPAYDAGVLTSSREMADYVEDVIRAGADAKAASNWIMGEVSRWLNENKFGIDALRSRIAPSELSDVVRMQSVGAINSSAAKAVFEAMLARAVSRRARHPRRRPTSSNDLAWNR